MNLRQKVFIILLFFTASSCLLQAQNSFWVKQVGDDSTSGQSHTIKVDKYGNTYYAGNFRDTVDFDPGPGVFNLITSSSTLYGGCPFISKLDASGNFVWAKAFTAPVPGGDWGSAFDIAVDDSENVYITGEYWGAGMDFDPGPGIANLPFNGSGDCYISKLDKSGNFLWVKQYASMSQYSRESGTNIKVDSMGNVYVVVSNYFSFQTDITLLKINAGGNIAWTKSIGGGGDEAIRGMAIGNDGNLYITGTFQDFINLPPFWFTGPGFTDSFLSKLDTSGNILWAQEIVGSDFTIAQDISLDNNRNIFIAGSFNDTVDFDPGPAVYNLISVTNAFDAFITKLDSTGNFVWVKSFGSINTDAGSYLALDSAANIYTIGTFRDTVDFDPGAGVYSMMAHTVYGDVFYSKLDSSGNFIWAKQLDASISQCLHGLAIDKAASIYTTGFFLDTADFDLDAGVYNLIPDGQYDMYIHKFRQCTPSSGTAVITTCDSLTWINGITYTASTNAPVFTIIGGSATNCDSIITLNLTITHSTTSTDSLIACDSLTWMDGNTYTSNNNTATYTLTNSVGCDSIVTLNLTINNVNVLLSYNTATGVLTATATGAISYQWLNCDSGYSIISGATSPSFTPLQNGNYAVVISQNGCTDTSACYPVLNVGMNELYDERSFQIFPNPANDNITLSGYVLQNGKAEIIVYNLVGEVIYTTTAASDKHQLKIAAFPSGVYFISVNNRIEKLLIVN